jgi:hypothetical protein
MEPYYTTPDGTIRIFHARWEDVYAAGVFVAKDIALVHADPPYGIRAKLGKRGAGRSINGGKPQRERAYPAMTGDEKPFDPSPLIVLDRPLVTWGANHYAPRLLDSPSWFLWDKRGRAHSERRHAQRLTFMAPKRQKHFPNSSFTMPKSARD